MAMSDLEKRLHAAGQAAMRRRRMQEGYYPEVFTIIRAVMPIVEADLAAARSREATLSVTNDEALDIATALGVELEHIRDIVRGADPRGVDGYIMATVVRAQYILEALKIALRQATAAATARQGP